MKTISQQQPSPAIALAKAGTKPQQPCVKLSPSYSSWVRPFWLTLRPSAPGKTNQSQQPNTVVRVSRALRVGLSALLETTKVNSRIATAIALMAILAPTCQVAYLLFPKTPIDPNWYHLNAHWYLFIIGPHLFQLTLLTGVFLLFPAHSKRAYFLLIPSGYSLAQIFHMSAAQNNDQFNSATQPHLFIMGVLCATVLFITANWLTNRQYHNYDALIARGQGLLMSNLDKDIKLQHLKTVFEGLRQFHRQY